MCPDLMEISWIGEYTYELIRKDRDNFLAWESNRIR